MSGLSNGSLFDSSLKHDVAIGQQGWHVAEWTTELRRHCALPLLSHPENDYFAT